MARPDGDSPRIVPFPGISDQAAPATLPTLEEIARADAAEAGEELPQLAVIGAAAEAAEAEDKAGSAQKADKRTARERLTSRKREAKPRKRRGGLIAGIVLIVLLLGAVGAAAGGFAWLRWYAHDDAADFQGTWYVSGTTTPIEITADAIQLTDQVSYRYALNVQDKTIRFTIGNMTGYGSYRFSLDRSQLVIFDGRTEADAVLIADARWLVQALIDEVTDENNDLTAGIRRNLTFLTREPLTGSDALQAGSDLLGGTGTDSEDAPSSSAANGGGDPDQPVWSAEEWLNANDPSSSSSTASNADDVGSLLENINDLPATDPAPTPDPVE